MCKRSMSGLWCLLLAFLADTYAQTGDLDPVTAVTLWQFGQAKWGPNWKDGQPEQPKTSIPLIPLGTASGGVATTYAFQVVNPAAVTTTNDEGLLSTEAILSTIQFGTIVASASGWFHPFTGNQNKKPFTGTIACSPVNSAFGDCVYINGEKTMTFPGGTPTPLVFQVTLTVPPTVTPTSSVAATVSSTPIDPVASTAPPTPTDSAAMTAFPTPTKSAALTVPPTPGAVDATPTSTSSAVPTTTKKSAAKTGALVAGVVVGGFVVLGTIVALCVFWRRRRSRLAKVEDGITTTGASAPWSWDAATHIQGTGVDTRELFAPQPVRAVPSWGKDSIGTTLWSPDTDARFSALTDSYGKKYGEGYTANAY
ncbi:hypothetical protein GGX14DRAFT_595196 [Mycena pura]|uniref:Mid2 domain-containing protein n=1 Tax=Mycena pura TaxID=153505 RepID=A0AAD6YJD5_9AGAR|nr:hypothetical protein GGX14DRAFT_595196 [Mycena pura]